MAEQAAPRKDWFFVQGGGQRSRRPVDVALLVLGTLLATGSTTVSPDRLSGDPIPTWVVHLSDAAYLAGIAYAVAVVVVVLLRAPKHLRLAVTVLAAGGLALAGSFAVWVVVDDYHSALIATSSSVLLVLRPWVTISFRRLHALIVAVQCLAAWAAGYAGPPEIIGAVGLGTAAASAVLVAIGSPGGHPDLGQVQESLRALGVPVEGLEFADRQPWGARVLHGVSADGPVQVKVYGRDATDAHRAARWWRSLVYRDQSTPGATRIQLVEHEALVTILADRAGVSVTPVIAAAASQGDAVLVLAAPPPPLRDEDLDDALLGRLWGEVASLHNAGLTHGDLTLEHIAGTGPVLSGFADGTIAASAARRAQEVATLLTALSVRIGPERAVATAVATLGNADVAAAQPFLQQAALPHSLHGTEGLKAVLAAIRDEIVRATGAEPLPPAPITRVTWRDLVAVGLIMLAAYALFTTFGQLDWSTVRDAWANADWRWVALGFVIAQLTAPVDAVSTMSMVPVRLPLRPLTMLQYAIKFVGLAISATVGKMAMNTALLAKYGVAATVAVTASALGSFVTALVNALVVLVSLPFINNRPDVHLGGGDAEGLLLLLGVVLVVSVVALALVRPLRRRVVLVVKNAWAAIRVVTDSPARGMLLFGSRLLSLMITAVALWCMVQAIHPSRPSLGYATVLVIAAAAAVFGAIVPVPGNVGVGEAALTAGLVAAGIPSGPAFAIAVTQRLSTSYLPDVFGAFAIRWLRKGDYI